jgi:hypothetical protein
MGLQPHMPRLDVVIVRVSGAVDGLNARLLAERVGKQLRRALRYAIGPVMPRRKEPSMSSLPPGLADSVEQLRAKLIKIVRRERREEKPM